MLFRKLPGNSPDRPHTLPAQGSVEHCFSHFHSHIQCRMCMKGECRQKPQVDWEQSMGFAREGRGPGQLQKVNGLQGRMME